MRKNNIIDYQNPSQNLVTDVLSEFLRESAQKMLQLATEEEVQTFISAPIIGMVGDDSTLIVIVAEL